MQILWLEIGSGRGISGSSTRIMIFRQAADRVLFCGFPFLNSLPSLKVHGDAKRVRFLQASSGDDFWVFFLGS